MKSKKIKNSELEKLKPKIVEILKQNDVKRAGIFGSYARGEQKKGSDLDILIEFDKSLLKLVALEMLLQKKLGRKIDLLTYNSINKLLKERILKEEVKIL